MEKQQPTRVGARNTEITRDEWKFNKFIMRKRNRYSQQVFMPLLRLQLLCKGIVTEDEWSESYENLLKFKWNSDSYIEEQQETDALMNKFGNMGSMTEYVGTYISKQFIYENVLRMTPEEIKREQERMAKEPKPETEPEGGFQ